ncbi:MAG: energy-coupling factor transporter transmembrane component T family protein [Candidatus Aminicenantales bacterium]
MSPHFSFENPRKKKSFIHELDPRAKLLGILALIPLILITPPQNYLNFGIFAAILFGLLVLSRPSWSDLTKSLIFLFPVLAFLTLSVFLTPEKEPGHHLSVIWNIWSKFLLSFLAVAVLRLTTDVGDLVKAVVKMKAPPLLTSILFLSLHAVFLLGEEAERMNRALESRSCGKIKKGRKIKVLFSLMFQLFDRAFSRSQKVLAAMLSRGFDGRLRTFYDFRLKDADFLFLFLVVVLAALTFVLP